MTPLLRAMFYGDSGAGKTYLVGTATLCPETTPLLVLNARGQPITFRLFENPPMIYPIKLMGDFNAPWEWIMNGQDWAPIKAMVKGKVPPTTASAEFANAVNDYFDGRSTPPSERKFKAIAIDSTSWTQRVSLNQIVGTARVLPGGLPQQAQIQHWGQTLRQMVNLTDLYYQLPIHVILTALDRHDMIQAYGTVMHYPAYWGQSRLELPSLAELVGRVIPIESMNASQVAGLKREMPSEMDAAYNALLTRGGRTFLAKWQGIRNNPEVILDPSIQGLINVLEKEAAGYTIIKAAPSYEDVN